MIEVRQLCKSYGDVQALRDVDFDVAQGEIVGLLGPNGAGKSTAMRILTGFLAPTSGSARVRGREVIDDPIAAQRHIGYLPEGNPLYLELRLIEALRFVAGLHGLRGGTRDKAIGEALEAAGLLGFERRRLVTLSRGYRQRVGLAQAILHKPPILILDEPSSGLDPNQQAEMRSFIRGLGERCAVIFSTHILTEVSATCDRAVVISAGRVVAQGTVAEVERQADLPILVQATVVDAAQREAAREAWARVPGVVEATLGSAEGPARLIARLDGPADAAALARLAGALQEAGVLAFGLAPVARSLDDAFARLTRAPAPVGAQEVAS